MSMVEFINALGKENLGEVKLAQSKLNEMYSEEVSTALFEAYRSNQDFYFRQNILEIFIDQEDTNIANELVKIFQQEKNEDLKFIIAVALGRAGNQKIIRHLCTLFKRDDFLLCNKVMFTLKNVGKNAAPVLIEELGKAFGQPLYFIKETLKKIENKEPSKLYELVQSDNTELAAAVLEVLGTIRTKENVIYLIKFVNNYNYIISNSAAIALYEVGEAISEFLGNELIKGEQGINYVRLIPEVLQKFGKRGQKVLLDVFLKTEDEDTLCSVLSKIEYSEEAFARIMQVIPGLSIPGKVKFSQSMTHFGEKASGLFYKKLFDPELDKNTKAVVMSAFIANDEINTNVLNEIYSLEEDNELKQLLNFVLPVVKPQNAFNIYMDMLKHRKFFMREAALDIMETLPAEAYKNVLEGMGTSSSGIGQVILDIFRKNKARLKNMLITELKEGNDSLKISSAFVIGELGLEEAVDQLVTSTKDGNEWVRNYSFEALKKIKGEDEARTLAPDMNG